MKEPKDVLAEKLWRIIEDANWPQKDVELATDLIAALDQAGYVIVPRSAGQRGAS